MKKTFQINSTTLEQNIEHCVLDCLQALINSGAIKHKKHWNGRLKILRTSLIRKQVSMTLNSVPGAYTYNWGFDYMNATSDAFNRSLDILVQKRNINIKELKKHYKGVGSKYYDIVTDIMETHHHNWKY